MMGWSLKSKGKTIFRRFPPLYHVLSRIYIRIHYLSRYLKFIILGTRAIESEWIARDVSSAKNYWENRHSPHRLFLIENIKTSPPTSILEIGCNCGPNLYQLAKKYPYAKIVGTDINEIAIHKGNEWLKQEGFFNIELFVGKAEELDQFEDKSFDVVFTWAVLLLIGRDKIKKIMEEIIRITRKEILFLEQYGEDKKKDPHGLGVYHYGYWQRDYVALLKQIIPEFSTDKLEIIDIPENIWHPTGGNGALIRFILD